MEVEWLEIPDLLVDEPLESRRGHCFQCAAETVLYKPEYREWKVTHGLCVGKGPIEGIVFAHAWVERGYICYDPVRDMTLQKSMFYSVGQVTQTQTYDRDTVKRLVTRTNLWGPWNKRYRPYLKEKLKSDALVPLVL